MYLTKLAGAAFYFYILKDSYESILHFIICGRFVYAEL
jgi:hypothetical protein